MGGLKNVCWVLVFSSLMNYAEVIDVENLKIGCYSESASSRQFSVSPGDYQPENLTPYNCVNLCGNMKYNFAGLQNGNLCFCASTFNVNASYTEKAICDINCTGNQKYKCGGIWANLVYNATSYTKKFVINYAKSNAPRAFDRINLNAAFVNESSPGLKVVFNIGDENGDSPAASAQLNFRATYWGQMIIKARPLNPKLDFVSLKINIGAAPEGAQFACPPIVRTGEKILCIATIHQGTPLKATWHFQEEETKNVTLPNSMLPCVCPVIETYTTGRLEDSGRQNDEKISRKTGKARSCKTFFRHSAVLSLPAVPLHKVSIRSQTTSRWDPLYVRAGPAVPQWAVSGLISSNGGGVFLMPSSKFMYAARILALEIYGQTAGNIRVFVMRPICSPPTSHYCLANLTCSSQPCSRHPLYACPILDIMCASKSCCVPAKGICSQSPKFTTLKARDLTIVADIGQLVINTGYNLHVIPKGKNIDVLPGDMIAWGPATDGNIAQQASEATTYHNFSNLNVQMLQLGSNISVNQSQVISNLTYMINVIGSQASTLELSHQYFMSGYYWAQVNFTDDLGNSVSPDIQHITVQDPLTEIEVVYPKGYSFFGARTNEEVEITVNVSTNSNFELSWTDANSSVLLKQEILQILDNNSAIGQLKHNFSTVGLHVILVEAKNNVSIVDICVSVYVSDALPDFNVSVISSPVYLGALTEFIVAVDGSNVLFKWLFDDGEWTPYISNTSVQHSFSKTGNLNVTIIANNLAFSKTTHLNVTVLHPLSITVPSQSVVGVAVNFSCSLLGSFSPHQFFFWDYGDGNTEKGIHKKQVSHVYSTGGTYNVSVKLQHDVIVYQSTEIFVLEPVTGLSLDNFPGMELFDSKTFVARTATGNNMTYEWYLQSTKTMTIMICCNNSVEIFFNFTGSFTMSVNVSNSISSAFASVSFLVQERISGLVITAFPNPAPSNTTITFNLTKGTGSDVKYRLDFGDGFVLRNVSSSYLFNRTFASGQWQVIFTGENNVSHVIVFYNVTVQDPLKNITVGFKAEKEINGRKLVPVGSITSFYSDVLEGTDVNFYWDFGDGSLSPPFKGSRISRGGFNHSIGHSFNSVGEFNVTVTASNAISRLKAWVLVHTQEKIEGFEMIVNDYIRYGELTSFQFVQRKGNNITYEINFGDGGSSQSITTNLIKRTYNKVGMFNVTAKAVNQLSTQKITRIITVQRQIKGFELMRSIKGAKTRSPIAVSWKITDGSNVTFVVDFGDGTPKQTLQSSAVGMNVTLYHNYTTWGKYVVAITAFNFVGPNNTIRQEAIIDDPIVGLVAYADRRTLNMFDSVTIVARILQGSRVTYRIDFGDGLNPVQTQTNTVTHQYKKYGVFNISVTAENSQSLLQTRVNDTITVEKPTTQLVIRGLSVSCRATTPGNVSEIVIDYQHGFLFHCDINFGDSKTETYSDETLPRPLMHTYDTLGSFQVVVKCENSLGSHTVKTMAHVEEILTGVKFKTGNGLIKKEFGQPVVVEWSWSTGTDVNQTVTLERYGVLKLQKADKTGFVTLDRTLCPIPGDYFIHVMLFNFVSSPQTLNIQVTFLEGISGLAVRFNPIVRTGYPTPFYVSVDSGLDVNVNWIFGDGKSHISVVKGHGKQKYTASHVYSTQAEFEAEVVVWNQNSRISKKYNITVIAPVQGFSFNQTNTVTWPENEIDFRFNRNSRLPNLLNASYYIDYGDGERSKNIAIAPSQTQFVKKRSYFKPGCYKAKLVIWNLVSRVELSAPIEVIEAITKAQLKAVHSKYSAHPGTAGRGPAGKTFPFEYPVSFAVTTDTGSCLRYNWSYGDFTDLRNVSSDITTHAYPLPGSYDIKVNIYNSLGEETLRLSIALEYSVMGLYLTSSGHGKPGEDLTLVVFCSSLGTNSTFVLDPGEGYNVTIGNFQNNTVAKLERFIDQNINLPFDPSRYYAKAYKHVYSSEGVFEAKVWGSNDASQQSARTSVAITNKSVPVLLVQVIGGKKSLLNITSQLYEKGFSLSTQVEILSNESHLVKFKWRVFKADNYHFSMSSSQIQLPPESGREISLPINVATNQASITVPAFGLDPGEYLFQVTATISGVGSTNTDHTYIKIAGADIEALIIGGIVRSHDWGQELLLNASNSRDLLFPDNELDYTWFCNIADGENGVVNSGGGCFGNGERQVEYTGAVFTIAPKILFESTNYVFTVNVSSRTTDRWSKASQTVKVLAGNPPDVQIRCESNCGKYLAPSSRLILIASCNCGNLQAISYNWSAEDIKTSLPFPVWPNSALTVQTSPNAVILGGTFNSGTSHRIRVSAKRQNSEAEGFAEYNIETNQPPKGGTCDVTPRIGEELGTTFTFTCSGWQDEHEPMTYEMFYTQSNNSKDQGSTHNSVLFFHGPSITRAKFSLPAGKKERGHVIEVMVVIKDAYGEASEITIPLQVKPRNMTRSELREKTLSQGNEIEKALGLGDELIAVQIIKVISNILNNQNDSRNEAVLENQRIRLMMIKYLADIQIQTLDDVLLGSQTLQEVTSVPKETTLEAQVLATKQFAKLAKKLRKEARRGEDGGVIETISSQMLRGLSNVFLASTSDRGNRSQEKEEEAFREVFTEVLNLTDKISDAVLDTMIPEQKPVVMKSQGVAIGLSKKIPGNLAGESLDVGKGLGQFVLPDDNTLMDRTKNNSYITATLTSLSVNPFQGNSNSTEIKTNPLSLVLKGPRANVIFIEGLTSPIDIILPQTEFPQIQLNISQTSSADESMTIHRVTLPKEDRTLKTEILPSDGKSLLTIYFRYNEPPTHSEYDFMTSLPRRDLKGENYTLFIPPEKVKGAGDYYFGVLQSAHDIDGEVPATPLNYTFDVRSFACHFWNETSLQWSSKGCRVHNQSTDRLQRCQCTHLTWFGGDIFIPPNSLNIKSSIAKLAEIYKHPALLATFCVIIGLYILGLLWARRKDRKDIAKVGLVPVLDNDPSDRYRYEVTVYTARGRNTGTTANVSILIAGEDGQSTVHMLKSTSRMCFQQGSVDSFLITTQECLGGLTFIRVWHDNSGKSPSWFLSQVVIRDIETDDKFFFLCNNWLACDEGDGQVDRLFPTAGKEELRDFVHLFKTKTARDFSDGHLWFSIAFRPVRSHFTCVQRVSCCLSLLMCSMLTNVLWHRTPIEKQNNVLIDLGFFEFTWHEIIIGIQSSLIVFPINLLIVQLFRNRAVSPKAKKEYAERASGGKEYKSTGSEPSKNRKQTSVSLSDITPTDSPRKLSRSTSLKQKKVTLKNLTSLRAPSIPRKDSWDDDFLASFLETEIGVALNEDSQTKKTTEKDNMEGDEPDFLSSDIYYYLYQDETRDLKQVSPGPSNSRNSIESTDPLVSPENPPVKTKKSKRLRCIFPWWFVYIGWFVCLSTAAAAGFFTLLYGLQFDNRQQEEWLVSMFISMFQDILISQPLKVIIMAIIFALLLKKPQDEEDDVINAELARDEDWLEKNLTHAPKGMNKTSITQSNRPPNKVLLHAARVRLFKERKMHLVIREILFYLLFVWMVLLIAYGHRDPYAHFMTQNMEDTFVGQQELSGTREDDKHETNTQKPSGNDNIKLADVTNTVDFWDWMNQTLVPGLYNGAWYNGKPGKPGFLNDKMSYVVGIARIRQLRVKSGTCPVDRAFEAQMEECNEPYSWEAEDQTSYYAPGWKPTNQNSSYNFHCSEWHYQTTADLKTRPIMGHLALYRGGGYKIDLSSSAEEAYSVINDLKSHQWVDKYTRAVFVEFTVYNGHSNLYCVANLLLEFTAAGGVLPFIQLLTTRIDRYVGNFLIFVLVCEVTFVLFSLYFTYREFKRFLKMDLRQYLAEFWTWIEVTLIGLSWTCIVLYGIRFALDRYTKSSFRDNPQKFVDFHHLALVDMLFGYVYAFVVFLTSVKFLRLFRFNRRMSLLGSTIKASARELFHFGIIFGLVFIGFSHLCYLVFSKELYKFHTFVTTIETLISVMLGKFSYVSLERTNRVLGPMMFFFYSIGVVFILVNMFLSIIIENFKKVKNDNDLQSNEHEIIDFIIDQFFNWLGFKSRSIFKNRVVAEEEFARKIYRSKKEIDQAKKLKDKVDHLVTLIKKVHFDINEDEDFLRNDGEVTYLLPENQQELHT